MAKITKEEAQKIIDRCEEKERAEREGTECEWFSSPPKGRFKVVLQCWECGHELEFKERNVVCPTCNYTREGGEVVTKLDGLRAMLDAPKECECGCEPKKGCEPECCEEEETVLPVSDSLQHLVKSLTYIKRQFGCSVLEALEVWRGQWP